jgi:hypothetical protein
MTGAVATPPPARPVWVIWLMSVGAVLAAAVVIVALSIATDLAAVRLGMFPAVRAPDFLFLEPLAYRSLYAVLGGFVAARLAPRAPVAHALALGVIGVAVSLLGAIMSGGRSELGPAWYSWALVATTLPLTWLGGRLAKRRT